MTAARARAYAEQIFRDIIEPVSLVSQETSDLIKERLAHAYMDGCITALESLGLRTTEEPLVHGTEI
jgi:hypothetical protein